MSGSKRKHERKTQHTPKRKKKAPITSSDVRSAEATHVGWMSESKYYQEMWGLVVKDFPTVSAEPAVIFQRRFKDKKLNTSNRIDLGFPILDSSGIKKQTADIMTQLDDGKSVVWPIGVLYEPSGHNIHWNVFIFSKQSVIQFDPGSCSAGFSCYAYSKQVLKYIEDASGLKLLRIATNKICQKDVHGEDAFCQTWVIFFVDIFLNTDAEDFEVFRTFDFFTKGKPLLKSWLKCMYKQLYHGEETWFSYATRTNPGLFKYVTKSKQIKDVPNLEHGECFTAIFDNK